ncbi:MAG: response regulator [Lachnospiraceae bacterium]|nr:response regulator [Lachnospiraceae bacterium]
MKGAAAKHFLFAIILIFILQTIMLAFIFRSFYKSSVKDINDLGVSNLKSQSSMIEAYLNKGGDVLWLVAETVDEMLKSGTSRDELTEYIEKETRVMQHQLDENFTAIYGYLNGKFVNGSGWSAPEGFDPTTRAWYEEAIRGNGKMVLTAPYMDVHTGKMIVSFCQMLSDQESVLSLDILLDEVQNIAQQMTMDDMGYCFITDSEGLVIAHTDPLEIGKDYSTYEEWPIMWEGIRKSGGNGFEMMTGHGYSTVFTDSMENGLQVVIVVQNSDLYHKLRSQILAGILLSLLIFAVIVVFCVVSLRRISKAELGEQESLERMQKMNMNIIRALASAIDAKDRYTSGHSQRVAEYAVEIARRMGKSEEELNIIYYAGILHDVGKIRVPNKVINKAGKLTNEEFDQVRIHPVSGYHIVCDIHDDARIGYGTKYHHERYDGKGYPNGLEGGDIPEIARIIAVADAYDAMASDRSYRKLLPQNVVRDEILKGKGSQFDPEIADIMLKIIDEDTQYELRQTEESVHNVLVVDDDRMVIMVLMHVLYDMEEVNVIGVQTKEEALAALKDNDISLIVLDLMMPDIDGFTLYQEMRKDSDAPVILMTGDRSMETIMRIRELGIDDYITKPLNGAITRETVHSVLHRSRSKL